MGINAYQYHVTGDLASYLPANVFNLIEQYECGVVHKKDNVVVLNDTTFSRPESDQVDRSHPSRFYKYKAVVFSTDNLNTDQVILVQMMLIEKIIYIVMTIFTLGCYNASLNDRFIAALQKGGEAGIAAAIEAIRLGACLYVSEDVLLTLAKTNRYDSLEFLAAQDAFASPELSNSFMEPLNNLAAPPAELDEHYVKIVEVFLKYHPHVEIQPMNSLREEGCNLHSRFIFRMFDKYNFWWRADSKWSIVRAVAKLFVKYGYSVDTLFNRWTASSDAWARYYGQRPQPPQDEAAQFWLDLGLNPTTQITNRNSLHSLMDMWFGDPKLLRVLLQNGAGATIKADKLKLVIEKFDATQVQEVLQYLDKSNLTHVPMMMDRAIQSRKWDVMKALIKYYGAGAIVDNKVLSKIVEHFDVEALKEMFGYLDKRDASMIMECALKRGDAPVMKTILDHFKIKPTAAHLESVVERRGSFIFDSLVQLLIEYGAPVSARVYEHYLNRGDFQIVEARKAVADKSELETIQKVIRDRNEYHAACKWMQVDTDIANAIKAK